MGWLLSRVQGNRWRYKQREGELAREPELFARVEALLGEVKAEQDGTLDGEEGRVVERLRKLGRETLEAWLRASEQKRCAPVNARKAAKKKSAA